MNRQEFIQALRQELRKLPPEEIASATEFYEEYFDEVLESLNTEGMTEEEAKAFLLQEEQRLAQELGSPKSIAAQIKSEYAARLLEGDPGISAENATAGSRLSAIWWVIIGICSAPVSVPLAIVIGCAAIAAICGLISLMAGIYAGIIGGAAGGLVATVCGFLFMGSSTACGVMVLGFGLLALSVCVAAGAGAFIGTRALIRGLAHLARTLNEKRRRNRLNRMRGGAGYEKA